MNTLMLPAPTNAKARKQVVEACKRWKGVAYNPPVQKPTLEEFAELTIAIVRWRDDHAKHIDGVGSLNEAWRILRRRHLGEATPEHELIDATERAVRACDRIVAWLGSKANPRKRRRQTEPRDVPLTPEQTEAAQLVGEHKGNFTAAARAAGKSPQAVRKLYGKAIRKIGRIASAVKPRVEKLPTDFRGQVNVNLDAMGRGRHVQRKPPSETPE